MAEGDNEIKSTRVILCEGAGDAAFLKHLINSRGLPGFYITYPAHTQPHEQGGRDGFKSRLKALKLARGFKDVTDIVVISDNDSDIRVIPDIICGPINIKFVETRRGRRPMNTSRWVGRKMR